MYTLRILAILMSVLIWSKPGQALESYPDYPVCNDTTLNNYGIYFDDRDGIRYWNHCSFPDPRTSPQTCAREHRFGDIWNLCNINHVLASSTVEVLDAILAKIGRETPNQCVKNGVKVNITVSLIALNDLRTTLLANPDDLCVNNCGEYFPELLNTSLATTEEVQFAVDVFAQNLAESWGSTLCYTTVAVVYWNNKNIIGTGVPTKLQKKLTWDEVLEIRSTAQQLYFVNGSRIEEGLAYVLNEYNEQLKDIAPAYWLVCITVLLLVVESAFLVWFLLGKSTSSQFDDSIVMAAISFLFRLVTGVLVFELLLRSMLMLDRMIRWWHAIIFAAIITAAFIIVIIVLFN